MKINKFYITQSDLRTAVDAFEQTNCNVVDQGVFNPYFVDEIHYVM